MASVGRVDAAWRWLVSVACLLLLSYPSCAGALDRGLSLDQLTHDRWTKAEGAPLDITSIAQTPDGFLWLASGEGLFRFDGVKFQKITEVSGTPLLHEAIRPMVVDASGAIWIAYRAGGVSVIRGDTVVNEPDRNVSGFTVDKARGLWSFARTRGVSLFANGSWQQIDETFGFKREWIPTRAPTIDGRGDVWIPILKSNRKRGVAHLANGTNRFIEIENPVDEVHLAATPAGTLWAGDLWGLRPLLAAKRDKRDPAKSTESWIKPEVQLATLKADRDGALWFQTVSGLGRVRFPELLTEPAAAQVPVEPEMFGPTQGLTSDVLWTIFEDREGSIWVGTVNGLDRFRDSAVATVRLPRRNRPFSIAAGDSGAVWACNSFGHVMRVSAGLATDNYARSSIESLGFTGDENVAVLHRGRDGALWVGGYEGGLWRSEGDKFEPVKWGGHRDSAAIFAITTDSLGNLWVAALGGVYQVVNGQWIDWSTELFGSGRPAPSFAWAAGPDGAVWTEGVRGGVRSLRRFQSGTWATFPLSESQVGPIISLQFYGDDLWVGGEFGVSVRRNGRFTRLLGLDGDEFERTSGVVVSADGDVWLNGKAGATRISAGEVASALASPTHRVSFRRFDATDHLVGAAGGQQEPVPSAVLGSDGRVWLATNAGIHWIDPQRTILQRSAPRPAVVTGVVAGTAAYAAVDDLKLPAGTRDLRIDFTAPNLTNPQRVKFRYRLSGLDNEWHDAGGRREAFYTNLTPGRYQFLVNATNELGAWAPADTAQSISIAPWWWQTRPFLAVCVLAFLGLVWSLFALRLRRIQNRLGQLYEERVAERERIAREIHDTFLQSVQALILQVHGAARQLARRVPADEPALAELEKALTRGDKVITEGRDRVLDLRSEANRKELHQAIADLGIELAGIHSTKFDLTVEGLARPLDPDAEREAYGIGREALLNAFRHARATSIEVQLVFDVLELRLSVRDNGVGFDESVAETGGRSGHFGLTGMRERASEIGASFVIWSRQGTGTGTEIDMRIPASRAYVQTKRRLPGWLKVRGLAKER